MAICNLYILHSLVSVRHVLEGICREYRVHLQKYIIALFEETSPPTAELSQIEFRYSITKSGSYYA